MNRCQGNSLLADPHYKKYKGSSSGRSIKLDGVFGIKQHNEEHQKCKCG